MFKRKIDLFFEGEFETCVVRYNNYLSQIDDNTLDIDGATITFLSKIDEIHEEHECANMEILNDKGEVIVKIVNDILTVNSSSFTINNIDILAKEDKLLIRRLFNYSSSDVDYYIDLSGISKSSDRASVIKKLLKLGISIKVEKSFLTASGESSVPYISDGLIFLSKQNKTPIDIDSIHTLEKDGNNVVITYKGFEARHCYAASILPDTVENVVREFEKYRQSLN